MNIYVIQTMVLLAFALIENFGNIDKNLKKELFRISVLVMFLPLFFRTYKIGSDLGRYHTHYKEYGEMGIENVLFASKYTNKGYYFYNALTYSLFSGNYQSFIALTSCLTFFPVIVLIRRLFGNSCTALYVYMGMGFYAFQFTGLKQAMAMGILCFAILSLIDNRRVPFYGFVLIASLFHFPALIFLPAYELTHFLRSELFLYFSVACVGVIYFFHAQIISFMSETYDSVIQSNAGTNIFAGKVIMILAICVYGYIFYTPKAEKAISIYLIRLIMISAILQMFALYGNVFERLSDYYFVYVTLYLPQIFSVMTNKHDIMINDNNRSTEFTVSVLVVLIAIFAYFWVYYRNVSGMLPYKTWLF